MALDAAMSVCASCCPRSYCPYCAKAKATMAKLLKPSDYLVIEVRS
jgi:glutaredoxin